MNNNWEYFLDVCYYDMWAVRPIGDKSFNSLWLFHVTSENEAVVLCDILNEH